MRGKIMDWYCIIKTAACVVGFYVKLREGNTVLFILY